MNYLWNLFPVQPLEYRDISLLFINKSIISGGADTVFILCGITAALISITL